MPVRGILFDKDGTLIDFRGTWLAAYCGAARDLAERAGLPPDFARELLGRLGYDVVNDTFTTDSPLLWATNQAVADSWAAMPELCALGDVSTVAHSHFGDSERYSVTPIGDLPSLLERLRGRGLKLGVATMDTTAKAVSTLDKLGLGDRVDFVTGYDGGYGEKPAPGMVHGFCSVTGLQPCEVMVVGDTAADLLMARAANAAMGVAVLTGATPRHVLDQHADHVIEAVTVVETLLVS